MSREIIKFRWLAIAFIGISAILFEVYERYQDYHRLFIDQEFAVEIAFGGVIFPVLGGLLLSALDRASNEKKRALEHLNLKQILLHQITNAPTWNILTQAIVEFPRSIIPLNGTLLMVYDANTNRFELQSIWGFYGQNLFPLSTSMDNNHCHCLQSAIKAENQALWKCTCGNLDQLSNGNVVYCLPLYRRNTLIAFLHLYLLSDITLTQDQTSMLTSFAPEIALAIDDANNKRINSILKETAEAERRKISRDLHDHLAQNLITMRHKLDLLTGSNNRYKINQFQKDLQQMREIIDEAYIMVRSTLKEMETNRTMDLTLALQEYTSIFSEKADYHIEFIHHGQSRPIPKQTFEQILAIFGETLSNIETHAQAKEVRVTLDWQEAYLTLTVMDDGRGFIVHSMNNGHMGLKIMNERAQEINCQFQVSSTPGLGTVVSLRLPLQPILELQSTY
jgi:signal transduction histidine kinase